MTRDETVIQTLTLINTLIGEEAFSEAWTSFLKELIDDEVKPIPFIDYTNYSEDNKDE